MTPQDTIAMLERRLERERRAREEAEQIAERTTGALYDRQRELELLESVATAANRAATLDEALGVTIGSLCRHAGWPLGHAYVVSPAHQLVSSQIWHVRDPAHYVHFRAVSEQHVFAPGDGLPGRVLSDAQPIWVQDVMDEENFPRGAELGDADTVHAAFAFPVLAGSEVVAVIELFHDHALRLDSSLLALAAQVGTQLGRVVERARARDEIAHQAMHDSLTGLPNRALLLDRIGHALARATRSGTFAGLVVVDLDRFKIVNDTHGHAAGNELIVQVSRRLEELVADGDTVARFGGDEFVVLCEEIEDERAALLLAERIALGLVAPFPVADEEQMLTASLGLALGGGGEMDAEILLHQADTAMYRAKDLGGSRHELFDEGMRERVNSRVRTERALRRAVSGEELRLFYQPVISLDQGRRVVGVEALVRWEDPERGLIPPIEFIPVAEETGLIRQVGEWVLNEACRQAAGWRDEFGDAAPLPININVAALQLADEGFAASVSRAVASAGISPADIALEITESALIENATAASHVLSDLRALGIRVLLDDFGTGYSSLSYLQRFPIDELKIDRSFVSGFGVRAEASTLVGAIVGMSQALGIGTVAEGIETEGQALEATRLGCDLGQGYLFAKPAPADTIAELVRSGGVSAPTSG